MRQEDTLALGWNPPPIISCRRLTIEPGAMPRQAKGETPSERNENGDKIVPRPWHPGDS